MNGEGVQRGIWERKMWERERGLGIAEVPRRLLLPLRQWGGREEQEDAGVEGERMMGKQRGPILLCS